MSDTPDALSSILKRLRLTAGIFTEAAYCGAWAVDTSGARMSTFHLVQSGDSWLNLHGEQPRQLKPGDFVLFPRDAKHLITSSEKLPTSVVVNEPPPLDPDLPVTEMLCGYFEFQTRLIWPMLDSLPEVLVIDMQQSMAGESRALLKVLTDEAKAGYPGRGAVIDLLAEVLFVHALRSHMVSGDSRGMLQLLAQPGIGRALKQLHAAPGESWTVENLASEAGMSRASFSQKFKDAVDDTPMNYLARWRMQVAIDELTTTEHSVSRISEDLGYSSEAAFRHAFKKVVGQTPGDIRRQGVTIAATP